MIGKPRKRSDGGLSYTVRVPGVGTVTVRDSLRAARQKHHEMWLEKRLGVVHTRPTTLGDETARHLRAEGQRNLRTATYRALETELNFWKPYHDQPINTLRAVELEEYALRRAETAPVMAHRALTRLRKVLEGAELRGQRVDPALRHIRAGRPPGGEEGRALTRDQVIRLSHEFPENLRRMILLAAMTGIRETAWFKLTADRVDLERGHVLIPATEGHKTRQPFTVPLTASAIALFREQLLIREPNPGDFLFLAKKGGPFRSVSHFRLTYFKDAVERAGLDGVTFHDLRHTAISHMLAEGLPKEVVAKYVGHKDAGKLALGTYRHLLPHEDDKWLRVLDKAQRGDDREREAK